MIALNRRKKISVGIALGSMLIASQCLAAGGAVAEGFDADSWWSKSVIVFGTMSIMFGMTIAYYFLCRRVKNQS